MNNVAYVQWIQDAAVRHFEVQRGSAHMKELGAIWVVRSHRIEYLTPAFAGEKLKMRTWIENVRRVRSLRRYGFARVADGKLLVQGGAEWVFVDARNWRPMTIPSRIASLFNLAKADPES